MDSSKKLEEQLFDQCSELPADQWERFLKEACPENAVLRESVLSLLRAHENQGGFLDTVPEAGLAVPTPETPYTKQKPDNREDPGHASRWWLWAIALTLITAVALVYFRQTSPSPEKQGITVNAFTVLAKEVLEESFPADLQAAIQRRLTMFKALETDTRYELVGDIQQVGQSLRIHTQLVDPATDQNVWSETYSRRLSASNFPYVSQDIADQIFKGMAAFFAKEDLGEFAIPPSYHPEALDAYQKAMTVLDTDIKSDIPGAIDELEKATGLDPNFALAYAGLAQAYFQYEQISSDGMSKEDAIRLIKPAIEKARAIHENLPPVQEALGSWHLEEGNLVAAEEAFNQALKADPEFADAWMGLAIVEIKKTIPRGYEAYAARMPSIMKQMEKAIALDPEAPGYRTSLGYALSDLGRIEEGIDQFQTSLDLNPKYAQAHANLADFAIEFQGQFDEALTHMRHALALDPRYLKYWVRTRNLYETLGDSSMALTLTERMLELREDQAILYQPDLYRLKGEADKAATAMRAIVDNRGIDWNYTEKKDARRRLLNYDLRNRLFEEARARYYIAVLWLFEENPEVTDYFNAVLASELAAVLFHTDESEQAEKLVDAAWTYFEGIPESYPQRAYQEALMLTLKGEQQGAVQVIEQNIRNGTISRIDLEDVRLDSLRELPEFQAAVSQWEEHRANQLSRFRSRESSGEVPSIPELTEN